MTPQDYYLTMPHRHQQMFKQRADVAALLTLVVRLKSGRRVLFRAGPPFRHHGDVPGTGGTGHSSSARYDAACVVSDTAAADSGVILSIGQLSPADHRRALASAIVPVRHHLASDASGRRWPVHVEAATVSARRARLLIRRPPARQPDSSSSPDIRF